MRKQLEKRFSLLTPTNLKQPFLLFFKPFYSLANVSSLLIKKKKKKKKKKEKNGEI